MEAQLCGAIAHISRPNRNAVKLSGQSLNPDMCDLRMASIIAPLALAMNTNHYIHEFYCVRDYYDCGQFD